MADDEQEIVHILGEGGTVFALALPLHETIVDRMERGRIRRVNPDGSPYEGVASADVPEPPTKAPPIAAAKAAWVGWAVASGADPEAAEAMTKTDLVERYGAS